MQTKSSSDAVNMATVTRELLDLIMKLPGKERAALLKRIKASAKSPAKGDQDSAAVTTELIDAVMKADMNKRCTLLGELKALNGSSKRKYSRIEYFAPIQYLIEGRLYNGYIRNISISGMFIETSRTGNQQTFYPGEPVTLNFEHPETKKPLKIRGQIVRITKTGLGIRFDETL